MAKTRECANWGNCSNKVDTDDIEILGMGFACSKRCADKVRDSHVGAAEWFNNKKRKK